MKLTSLRLKLSIIPSFFLLAYPLPANFSPAPAPPQAPAYTLVAKIDKPLPPTNLQPQTGVEAVYIPPPPQPVIDCGSDPYMAQIYQHESGCDTASVNYLGCAGLGQACPGSKLPCSLYDWTCQNNYFISYADSVYGSPALAWAAWQLKGWW